MRPRTTARAAVTDDPTLCEVLTTGSAPRQADGPVYDRRVISGGTITTEAGRAPVATIYRGIAVP